MDKERFSTASLKAVLNRYVQGTASPEEIQQIERWYNVLGEAPDPALLSDADQKEQLRREIVSGIMAQIQDQQAFLPARRRSWRWVAAAAVLILVAGTGIYYLRILSKPAAIAAVRLYTPPGVRKTVSLSDGSVAHLNAGTTLIIAAGYGQQERCIELQGEAFFEVAADPEHPFKIRSGKMVTEVLGTSFNVRAYQEQRDWQVAVASGKVRVLQQEVAGTPHVLATALTANQELAYDPATHQSAIRQVNSELLGAWRNNRFNFNNSTLGEIAAELQRQYNVKVTISGEGAGEGHYKISFEREPLPQVLKVLSGLTGITYTINQDEIIIYTAKTH